VARGQRIEGKGGIVDIHFSVIRDQERGSKVLIAFESKDAGAKGSLARGESARRPVTGNRRK
jgi:hypothetical protein